MLANSATLGHELDLETKMWMGLGVSLLLYRSMSTFARGKVGSTSLGCGMSPQLDRHGKQGVEGCHDVQLGGGNLLPRIVD